jgi:hypothetical protein
MGQGEELTQLGNSSAKIHFDSFLAEFFPFRVIPLAQLEIFFSELFQLGLKVFECTFCVFPEAVFCREPAKLRSRQG